MKFKKDNGMKVFWVAETQEKLRNQVSLNMRPTHSEQKK